MLECHNCGEYYDKDEDYQGDICEDCREEVESRIIERWAKHNAKYEFERLAK